jgi:hypothetical protein
MLRQEVKPPLGFIEIQVTVAVSAASAPLADKDRNALRQCLSCYASQLILVGACVEVQSVYQIQARNRVVSSLVNAL